MKIPFKPNKKRIVILLIVVAAVFTAVYAVQKFTAGSKPIKVSGTVEGDEVRLAFRVDGQIQELLADEGTVIKKGDIIARLDKDELTQKRDEAAASLKLSQAQYTLDEADYQRAESLFASGAVPAQQRDEAKTKVDTDKAAIEKLTASLELAKIQLDHGDLVSPLNGYITVKSAEMGEVVQAGSTIFTAIDLANVWVTGYVNETDLGKIKINQKAYIKTDSYPDKKYDGSITFISSQTEFTPKYIQTSEERVKYVYRIKVKVDNSSLDLKPGMPADAYIVVE